MTVPSQDSHAPLQIQKACPKSWDELTGAGKQRFCSSCSLHVHDAVQLTQKEAEAIVSSATSRVCMRLQYDAAGQPIYSDTRADALPAAREPQRARARLARWAVSAAAGLLAACNGGVSDPAPNDPAGGTNGAQPPSKMGKVCAVEKLGDVAMPLPQGIERLGEVSAVPAPTSAPTSPPPPESRPVHDGQQ